MVKLWSSGLEVELELNSQTRPKTASASLDSVKLLCTLRWHRVPPLFHVTAEDPCHGTLHFFPLCLFHDNHLLYPVRQIHSLSQYYIVMSGVHGFEPFLACIMPVCNIVVWLLFLCVSLLILQQLQSTIFTPLCALPFLRSSDACRAVQLSLNFHWCSATPFISSTNWCQNIGQTSTESGAKVERLTPAVISDIHDLLTALDDLTLMVEQSALKKHVLLCGQIKLVLDTGLACKNEIQKYASQLSGALKL